MSSQQRLQPVGSTQTAVDLLDVMERLQRFDGPAERFLSVLLASQCELAQASGGAVLRFADNTSGQILAVHPAPTGEQAATPVWLSQAAESIGKVMASGQTLVLPIQGSEELYGQRPNRHLVLVPLRGGAGVRGVAAFHLSDDNPNRIERARERLELSVSLLSLYEMRLTLQKRSVDLQRLREATQMLSRINEQGRFKAAAFALCNETAGRFDADRVSLGYLKGRYVRVEAMSHTEKFSGKTKLVQDIEAAMEECLDQDLEILAPAPPEAGYVCRATTSLANRHGPTIVCSLPIRQTAVETRFTDPQLIGGRRKKESGQNIETRVPFAVLTVERPVDRPFTLDEVERLRLVCDLTASRLYELHQTDRWIGALMATEAKRGAAALLGPRHTWAKLTAIGVVAFLLAVTLIKGEYRVESDFIIQPDRQLYVSAPFDGRIDEVFVERGDEVVAGETVLARLDTTQLERQRRAVQSEIDAYMQKATEARRDGKPDEAEAARREAERLLPQLQQLDQDIAYASLTSAISGTVIQEEVRDRLNNSVSRGESLFVVTPIRELEAELLIPESRIPEIHEGQRGELTAQSHPGRALAYTVTDISPVAEVVDSQNIYRVTAKLDDPPDWLLPGAQGVARSDAGRRSYAYIWTRDLIHWLRMKLWL